MTQGSILALDQGSSHSRALLFDPAGRIVARAEAPLSTYYPRPEWVEHDAEEVFESANVALRRALRQGREKGKRASALAIANQRSTLVVWDRRDGKPLAPAISWQDRRTAGTLHSFDHPAILEKTGLPLSPHYSATKLAWLLRRLRREKISQRHLLCGTVNTFLLWRLTGGKVHWTDPTNAARMLLYNLARGDWDDDLLDHFKIPRAILPEIVPTLSSFGTAVIDGARIPITCCIGDQQAALAGLGALDKGMVNINYGTGGFFLVNTGGAPARIPRLLTGIAWSDGKKTTYLVEGTVNAIGSLFSWLGELGLLKDAEEIDAAYGRAAERLFMVPALAGLGAPHWDPHAQTALFGLTRTSRREEIIRAAVEGIAFLMNDIYRTIKEVPSVPLRRLIAGGGGSRIKSLIQFQADLFGTPIAVTDDPESTIRGAAFLAGLQGGLTDRSRFSFSTARKIFSPQLRRTEAERLTRSWKRALALTRAWSHHPADDAEGNRDSEDNLKKSGPE